MVVKTLHKIHNKAHYARRKLIKTYLILYFVRICFRVRIEKFTNFRTLQYICLTNQKPEISISVQNGQNINYNRILDTFHF